MYDIISYNGFKHTLFFQGHFLYARLPNLGKMMSDIIEVIYPLITKIINNSSILPIYSSLLYYSRY